MKYHFQANALLRQQYTYETSKLLSTKYQHESRGLAIEICHQLYKRSADPQYLRWAFVHSQISKNQLLREQMLTDLQAQIKSLKPEDQNLWNQYQSDLVYWEGVKHALDKNILPDSLTVVEKKILDLKEKQNRFVAAKGLKKIPMDEEDPMVILKELNLERQSVLDYFQIDSLVYAFHFTKGYQEFKKIGLNELPEKVEKLRTGIYNYILDQTSSQFQIGEYLSKYKNAAHYLYKMLLEPFEEKLEEKLLIIPDGLLNYIPFDALLTEIPSHAQFGEYPYVLKKYQIGLAYSLPVHFQMLKTEVSPKQSGILAISPSYRPRQYASLQETRSGLFPLLNNQAEAADIVAMIGGKHLDGTEASRAQFMLEAPNFAVLHLATHGKSNDVSGNYSYLAFSNVDAELEEDYLLYNRSLALIPLQAEMVVLSACETGIGQLSRGEGIIGMARGFAQSGAKSIITTLWAVNDEATKEIMIPFYQNIKAGKNKDEALRLAKLGYLNNHTGIKAHPFYWAGFVCVGDVSTLDGLGSFSFWYWFIVPILSIGLLIFLLYQSRRLN